MTNEEKYNLTYSDNDWRKYWGVDYDEDEPEIIDD